MSLSKEAIEKLVELGTIEHMTFGGVDYTSKRMCAIEPPTIEASGVATLTAIRDYLESNPDKLDLTKVILHVVGHDSVRVISVVNEVHRTRETYLVSRVDHKGFTFGRYMSQEEFVVALQSFFVQGVGDIDAVLKCAGNLSAEASSTFGDDGVTQTVTGRVGIVRNANVEVPNPVTLAPFRTFLEVEQPASKFVFRIKQGNHGPELALFEADGGNWKLDSIKRIAQWLEAELPEAVILA